MSERSRQQEQAVFVSPVREFCFDPKKGVFVIKNKESQTEQSPKNLRDIYQLNCDFGEDEIKQKVLSTTDEHSLGVASPFFTLIEFPSLRKWIASLSTKDKKNVSQKVMRTMERTYETIEPSHQIPKGSRGTFMSFNANLYEDGRFNLSVFGNCACLGATPNPISINYDPSRSIREPDLPVELTLHNIDFPVQGLSLYAGAGTIAWLKKQAAKS